MAIYQPLAFFEHLVDKPAKADVKKETPLDEDIDLYALD